MTTQNDVKNDPNCHLMLDKGFVRLVDVMGTDASIVQAARVSYGAGTKTVNEDRGLIRYLLRHHHCYHPSMEVLTVHGWKKWSDCGTQETFLVPDPVSKSLSKETLNVVSFDVDQELYTFANNRMSYKVTADHKMWFKGKYQKDYQKILVQDMSKWGWFEPITNYNFFDMHEDVDFVLPPEFCFIGFFLGDGCGASANRLSFHLTKKRKIDYLINILNVLGLEYTVQDSSDHVDGKCFYVTIPHFITEWIDVKLRSHDKSFPLDRLHELSLDQIAGLFDGLVNSDGHDRLDREQICFSSVSKNLIYLFTALAPRLGMDAHSVAIDGELFRATAYSASGRTSLESRKQYHGREQYSGKVFCTTTSTGLLVVRGSFDSFAFICGNTTPFEMCELKFHVRMPIFVARQWLRHRTACLSGDTVITFDLPKKIKKNIGYQAYNLTVKEIFEKFQPTKNLFRPDRQKNPFHKRDRIRDMMLRSCDESALLPYHTKILDIWENGKKPLIRVNFQNGFIRATSDHKCFTENGWLSLHEALKCNVRFARFGSKSGFVSKEIDFSENELAIETWMPVPGHTGYSVSNLGRVRSFKTLGGKIVSNGKLKKITRSKAGYGVVSLSCNGKSVTRLVHHLVLESFKVGIIENGLQTRHLDNNRMNNKLENLAIGTPLENSSDRMCGGCDQELGIVFEHPISYLDDGEEMTYDMSVIGPYHNFSAGGTVVHNSVNEESARYSEMTDEFYFPAPEDIQPQSSDNKQGRNGEVSFKNREGVTWVMDAAYEVAYKAYQTLLGEKVENFYDLHGDSDDAILSNDFDGVARELARVVMPVASYTEFYWKVNLHNLFHFLKLRADPHAQKEIRVFAEAMIELARKHFPVAVEAWEDYIKNALTISRMEVETLRYLLSSDENKQQFLADYEKSKTDKDFAKRFSVEYGMNTREMNDFGRKFLDE